MITPELIRAAESGDAAAQNNLGLCYEDGKGVDIDYYRAAKYYQLAADQGLAAARHNLGRCYELGYGRTKNHIKAVEYYQLAADQGLANAQHGLGLCYEYGKGVAQDYFEAFKFYQLAANQGQADVQAKLKEFIELEQGLPREKLIEILKGTPGNSELHKLAFSDEGSDVEKASNLCRWARATYLFARNEKGWTALHIASALGNEKMVGLLMGLCRTSTWFLFTAIAIVPNTHDDINVLNSKGLSALSLALIYDRTDVARLLLVNSAKLCVNDFFYAVKSLVQARKKSLSGIGAREKNLDEIYKRLVKDSRFSAYDNSYAIASLDIDTLEFVKALEVKYAGPNSIGHQLNKIIEAFNPAKENSFKILKFYEKCAMANFVGQSKGKDTVWHLVARENKLELVDYFVNNQRSTINTKNEEDKTALDIALYESKNDMVAQALIKAGATAEDKDLKHLVMLAVQNDNVESLKYLMVQKTVRFMVDHIIEEGKTALYLAVEKGRHNLVNFLLEIEADADTMFPIKSPLALAIELERKGGMNAKKILEKINNHIKNSNISLIGRSNVNSSILRAGIAPPLIPALEKALLKGDEILVKELLDNGANAAVEHKEFGSLLHMIASRSICSVNLIRLLLDYGAPINKVNSKGYTALNYLLLKSKTTIVDSCIRELLYRGADPNISINNFSYNYVVKDNDGNYIIEDCGPKNVIANDFSSLCLAAYRDDLDSCKLLVEWGAIIQHIPSINFKPLEIAVARGNIPMIKYLLKSGAQPFDPSNVTEEHKSYHGYMTPFIEKNFDEVKHFFMHYSPGNQQIPSLLKGSKTEMGSTFFHAAKTGDKDTLIRLLEHGADLDWTDEEENTALHISALNGQVICAIYLLKSGIYVNQRNKVEDSPLMLAVRANNMYMTQVLMDHGAEVNQENLMGITPLHYAAQIGSLKLLKFLLSKHADVNAADEKGRTVLMFSCLNGNIEPVKFLISKTDVQIEQTDKDGKTELDYAIESNNDELVKYLLESGLQVDKQSKESYLHSVTRKGRVRMVQLLLSYINVNELDAEGKTALYLAVELGLGSIVQLLLSEESVEWKTAYSLAQKKGDNSILALFDDVLTSKESVDEAKIIPPILNSFRRHGITDYSAESSISKDIDSKASSINLKPY